MVESIASHTVAPETADTAYRYLIGVFEELPSRKQVKKALHAGRIKINGKVADQLSRVADGDLVELFAETKPIPVLKVKMDVLFEDEHFAIVFKPGGIRTNGNASQTLERALPFNLEVHEHYRPRAVHRLDEATSGLVLCAKTPKATKELSDLLANRKVKKTYIALASGKITEATAVEGKVDGKEATTIISPIQSYTWHEEAFTFVECQPLTGRKHQIRLHLEKIGCPIFGDPKYGRKSTLQGRGMYLTAIALELTHPFTCDEISIRAELPGKFKTITRFLQGKSAK